MHFPSLNKSLENSEGILWQFCLNTEWILSEVFSERILTEFWLNSDQIRCQFWVNSERIYCEFWADCDSFHEVNCGRILCEYWVNSEWVRGDSRVSVSRNVICAGFFWASNLNQIESNSTQTRIKWNSEGILSIFWVYSEYILSIFRVYSARIRSEFWVSSERILADSGVCVSRNIISARFI